MNQPNAQAVLDYSTDILPTKSGDSVYVKGVGIAVIEDGYEIEFISFDLAKITKIWLKNANAVLLVLLGDV